MTLESSGVMYRLELTTIPKKIYKESDQLWPVEEDKEQETYDTESWAFYIVAKITQCDRPIHPSGAKIELITNGRLVKTLTLDEEYLAEYLVPEEMVASQTEKAFILVWNHFIEPTALNIDILRYTLQVRDAKGMRFENALDIPLRRYDQKAVLLFPLKGKSIIAVGHEFNEHHRLERSQFAYDIFPLGPNAEMIRKDGTTNEDWWGFGVPVIAPADGVVVYAREDIPENERPNVLPDRAFFKTVPDPLMATAGNCVVIDHGNEEFSLLAHLKQGSVLVQKGEHVNQGQKIGCVGNSGRSGAPHLHYELMSGPAFGCDGLPSHFENLKLLGLEGKVASPKRGLFLVAE